MRGIADDRTIRLTVARVADELRIPDAYARLSRGRRSEDSYHRADFPSIGRKPEMVNEGSIDLICCFCMTHIPNGQRIPVKSANAARIITPGNFCPVCQFIIGLPIGSAIFDLPVNFGKPPGIGSKLATLLVEQV